MERKTSTDLDVFDVNSGSEHRDKLLPCIRSHVLAVTPAAHTLLAVGVPLWGVGHWWERESFCGDLWH